MMQNIKVHDSHCYVVLINFFVSMIYYFCKIWLFIISYYRIKYFIPKPILIHLFFITVNDEKYIEGLFPNS